jgi:anti-anti-sigma factor
VTSRTAPTARAGHPSAAVPTQRGQHPPTSPQVSSSFDGRVVVVGISGDLDPPDASRVWHNVVAAVDRATRSAVVVLDLTRTTFLDPLGLTTLVNLHQRSRRQEVELRVVAGPSQSIRRVLRLSGVDDLLSLHDSVEKATSAPAALCRTVPAPPAYTSPGDPGPS